MSIFKQKSATRVTDFGMKVKIASGGVIEVDARSIVDSERVQKQAKEIGRIVQNQRAKTR